MPQSIFEPESQPSAAAAAARIALSLRPGHYDELRDPAGALRPHWRQFFELLGPGGLADLDHRAETVARQVRENGITYNVYSDDEGASRPWSLDLLPFIITEPEWARIERAVTQRAALLNAVLTDVYGPQRLLHEGLLPPALVYGHPGYLRPLAGAQPPGGVYLHIAAFDLARTPNGEWCVVSQRTQAPSGLGYALENRLIISRRFPEAFREMRVQRLASTYQRLLDTLTRLSPAAEGAQRTVLLTPGPYNETYFEHAYLARYLGIPLVEGSDLTVREDQVFLKSVYGLERVHAILRRLDDDFCDPLELRADSALGVPGLLQAVRAGNVLVANALGSSFLESTGVLGFLPAIARRLLGEELVLPSLATWWCGEAAAREAVLGEPRPMVIKPTYPAGFAATDSDSDDLGFEPVIGAELTPERLGEWREHIAVDPAAFTIQAYTRLSQMPTWVNGLIAPRSGMVRVFAIAASDGTWHALPGGLTRIASSDQSIVSMQRGGSSADTWVLTSAAVDAFSLLPTQLRPEDLAGKRRSVSSRAAENLFWVGRYAERAENNARIARLILSATSSAEAASRGFLDALEDLCAFNGLLPFGVRSPGIGPRAFERALIAHLPARSGATSVGYNLAALARAAGQIRDRLSPLHWSFIVSAAEEFEADVAAVAGSRELSAFDAVAALTRLKLKLGAITGAQSDRMTRDDGWRLLTIGRQLERLAAMAGALATLVEADVIEEEAAYDFALGFFDSMITHRGLYQRRQEMPALVDLLVLDVSNPRSFARIVRVLRAQLTRLPPVPAPTDDLVALLPSFEAGGAALAALCARAPEGGYAALAALARSLVERAHRLSDEIGQRYFSHASDAGQSLNA